MGKNHRHPLRPDFHQPGTLLAVFTDGLGLRERNTPAEESNVRLVDSSRWENVWLKSNDVLIFLEDGNLRNNVPEMPYIKCMSKTGIIWVHPNTISVLVAIFPDDLPGQPKYFEPESSWV